MARIKDIDVVAVRERARIDEVIRDLVALKPAGGGSLKGLCPFHDERSPSFHVTPAKGFWHCFGCSEGGDVIDFIRKIDHLSFAEAVEKLAARTGIQLRYEEGSAAPDKQRGQRIRLVEAHAAAAAFYSDNLSTPDAKIGRDFLKERDFDAAAAAQFGVGFAPLGWDGLTKHLRSKGFSDQELIGGGLAVAGNRGAYDRFRGRLVWPIRESSGDVIGFGARKLREDDDGPKYLNTPETPLYKKSQVLYGVDLARREISKRRQAVIVEGYTDVMAAHLSGVETAVATCGTSFAEGHIRVLRRLLMDQDELRGEVIFLFDGDEAGRKAARRAFSEDQKFVAQTFVAIEKSGLDPCELRLKEGSTAVRDLVARRTPLFRFVIESTLADYNLDTAEGRVAGLRAVAPILASIKDQALRPQYLRTVGDWLSMDPATVSGAVREAAPAGGSRANPPRDGNRNTATESRKTVDLTTSAQKTATGWQRPSPRDTAAVVEREALKCAVQVPHHVAAWYASIEPSAFTAAIHTAVHQAITGAGSPTAAVDGREWIEAVLARCPDDDLRGFVRELAIESLRSRSHDDEGQRVYAQAVISRLLEMDATRRIVEVKGRLQRTNPTEDTDRYNKLFLELLALQQYCRSLRERALDEVISDGEHAQEPVA